MTRKTAADFHPEVLKLFDQYVHGQLSRRGFLDRAAAFAVGSVTAGSMLAALSPNYAAAEQVAPGDARLTTHFLELPSAQGYGRLRGYLAAPVAAKGKLPALLVVHENRGLNPHIKDIARRLALENFIAFAPDALFQLGGYPGNEDKARELFQTLDQAKLQEDFVAAAGYLKTLPAGSGKVGVIGFCYGGGIANILAARLPDLAAAVSFYGPQPSAEKAADINAPLMLHFAEQDDRINAGWPAYETALKKAGVNYQAYIYPGVQHGFNNDTTPRYDKSAANLAWQRSIDFLNETLRA